MTQNDPQGLMCHLIPTQSVKLIYDLTGPLGEPLKPLKILILLKSIKTFNSAEKTYKNLYFDEKTFIFGNL